MRKCDKSDSPDEKKKTNAFAHYHKISNNIASNTTTFQPLICVFAKYIVYELEINFQAKINRSHSMLYFHI